MVKCDGPLLYTYLCRLHLDRRAHDGPHRFLPPLVLLGKQHEHRDCGQDDHDDVTDHLEDEANREEADPVHYLAEQDAGEDERDEVNDDEKAVAADQGARRAAIAAGRRRADLRRVAETDDGERARDDCEDDRHEHEEYPPEDDRAPIIPVCEGGSGEGWGGRGGEGHESTVIMRARADSVEGNHRKDQDFLAEKEDRFLSISNSIHIYQINSI